MLTKFEFGIDADSKAAQVTARTRFLRSDAYQKMITVRRPVYTEFGTKAYPDSTKSMWSRLVNRLVPSDLTDNDLANVYELHGELYVSTESCNLWKVDPNNLQAMIKVSLYVSFLQVFQCLVRVCVCVRSVFEVCLFLF